MLSKKQIELLLVDLLFFVEECHQKTSYTDDRIIYARDAIMVISWIKKLNTEITIKEFYKYIDNGVNAKLVFDTWRQGHWGESFEGKFIKLKDNLLTQNAHNS